MDIAESLPKTGSCASRRVGVFSVALGNISCADIAASLLCILFRIRPVVLKGTEKLADNTWKRRHMPPFGGAAIQFILSNRLPLKP